jgi:hypothetical protein
MRAGRLTAAVRHGNPGKRWLNPLEPRPEPALPACPPELGLSADKVQICEINAYPRPLLAGPIWIVAS